MRLALSDTLNMHVCMCTRMCLHVHRSLVKRDPPLLWSIFSRPDPRPLPLSGPAASTSQACAGSRAPCPTLRSHLTAQREADMPLAGAEVWSAPSRAPTPKAPGLACQRLGSGQTPSCPPHPSDNTAAEASGVPGEAGAERPCSWRAPRGRGGNLLGSAGRLGAPGSSELSHGCRAGGWGWLGPEFGAAGRLWR